MGLPYWSLDEPTTINDMTQLPRSGRWESQLIGNIRANIVNETNRGVRYGSQLFSRVSLPGVIFEFPVSAVESYRAISEATFGRVLPFYFLFDGDAFSTDVLYVRLEEDNFEPEVFGPGVFGSTLQQWYRWTMRVSTEVIDLPLED